MSQIEDILARVATDLDEIAEKLDEIADWAEEWDYTAIQHKIQEGVGRIYSAATAARQYADGTLPIRN